MKFSNLYLLLSFLILILCANTLNAQTEEVKNAETIANKIISDSERYFKSGELNLKDNRVSQAMEDFDRAVEVFLFSTINTRRNKKLNESYLQLIDKIHQMEMSSKNKSVQNKNLSIVDSAICPKTNEFNKTAIELLIQSLNFYKNQGYDDSTSLLRKVLVEEPMNPLAYLLMGKIHLKRDDLEQAVSSFKTALFWDNQLIEAHIELGRIYIAKGDELQAKNYLQTALDSEQDNPKTEALSRLINRRATENDKRVLEEDTLEIENWMKKLTRQKTDNSGNGGNESSPNLIFVAPFQSTDESRSLGQDFSYVLSNILAVPTVCVISYDKNKSLLESFGLKLGESFTLATSIKLAMTSKASLLIVGSYEVNKRYSSNSLNSITATAKVIKVNEGRFLSEELYDGKRVVRNIIITDKAENLRTTQGQIAYQILYQQDKMLPYSQNQFVEKANSLKLPKRLENALNLNSSSDSKPDFSIKNELEKTNCSENALNNLQIRSFKLGMSFNEIIKTTSKIIVKNISSFEKQILIFPKTSATKELRFKDIDSIQLNFHDNYLYSIGITYDDTINWNTLDEFSSQVEKTLNLPKIKNGEYEFDGNYLFCGNYQMKIMFANYKIPVIHLFDTTFFDKIQQRKKEERDKILQKQIEEEKQKRRVEEEKKKVFKP